MDTNLDTIADAVRLSRAERHVLALSVLTSLDKRFGGILAKLGGHNSLRGPTVLGDIFDLPTYEMQAALSPTGGLFRMGLITLRDMSIGSPVGLMDLWVTSRLVSPDFQLADFLKSVADSEAPAQLEDKDFAWLGEELDWVAQYLTAKIGEGATGTNILLHGPPGTGKTELARLLAKKTGASLFAVPTQDREFDPIASVNRLSSYALAQRLMSGRGRTLLLFDDVDDVFQSVDRGVATDAHTDIYTDRKGWINRLLESNPCPSIWIANHFHRIEPAFARRFDHVLKIDHGTFRQRNVLVDRYLPYGSVPDDVRIELQQDLDCSPADVERMARTSQTPTCSVETRGQRIRLMKKHMAISRGLRGGSPHLGSPTAHYNPDWSNTSHSLDKIGRAVAEHHNLILLLHGQPGTGKSQCAQYLAYNLDRPIIVQRASDILDKYLGESEKRLAEAFRLARAEGAAILIDEIDSLLAHRRDDAQGWEARLVNEALSQIDGFDGLLIATTNRLDAIDGAALRRFALRVEFRPLRGDQAKNMFLSLTARYQRPDRERRLREAARSVFAMGGLVPADFALVEQRLRVLGEADDPDAWVAALMDEKATRTPKHDRPAGAVH